METGREIVNGIIINDIIEYTKLLKYVDVYIRENEWYAFFDTVYDVFDKRQMKERYYGAIEAVIADAFLKSQYKAARKREVLGIKKIYTVTLYDILCSLNILLLFKISQNDVKYIYDEIVKQCSWGELIELKDYQKEKIYVK